MPVAKPFADRIALTPPLSNLSEECYCFFDRFEEDAGMPRKRYRPAEVIGKLREGDALPSQGKKVGNVSKTRVLPMSPATGEGNCLGNVGFAGQPS